MAPKLPADRPRINLTLASAFATALRSIRNAKGLNQQQLANAANLRRHYLSLLESGTRQPRLDTIFSLADGLGIAPRELIAKIAAIYTPTRRKIKK